MELALLTDAFIVISIYDANEKRVTTFQSHEIDPDFSEMTINAHERFRPGDVSLTLRMTVLACARIICIYVDIFLSGNQARSKKSFALLLTHENVSVHSTINTCSKTTTNR